MKKIPILSVVGTSNSGKTTLIEKVIQDLKRKGYRIAIIKHSHKDFEIDRPGKDTYRHGQAGADIVVLSSPYKVAIMETVQEERDLEKIVQSITEVDLILTEGYKKGNQKKIEVHRACLGRGIITPMEELLAVASDDSLDLTVPLLHIDDIEGITQIIEQFINEKQQKSC
ncbi:molybdopterin-guanine dinucleotide biosynthesis protein B [Heliorestis convoluta]|uniref:Molybdopterin-guanine dinucleotide biosynthesis protein B n=1 Tax=Heliorestis convoluta TaxID=356322 RepID=A0A5Q2MYJ2_9FIRM|nr:molybdopterin-guanine dinucleotide biosynthesis protein B [Heliorestis convoluta]QGG47798.1 molybdopterin-guanine dinucleotide biosynthesis protein B [Heliorestis convoluta]